MCNSPHKQVLLSEQVNQVTVAKVLETLYRILAEMAWRVSSACDPPSTPYPRC